jgi:hypothetical protein
MTQSPGMSELIEAAERLRSIECGPGYARAVMDAYGQRPEGQLYDDLGTVTASVPTLLDDLAAAQGEIERLRGALREFLNAGGVQWMSGMATSSAWSLPKLAAASVKAHSALTLKSEKEGFEASRDLRPQPVASEPKNSDVQQVKP